jgi:hypothetical protein
VLFWQRSKILNNFTPRYGEIRNRGRRTVVYSLYRKIFNMSENSGYNTHTERDKYKHDLSCLGGVTVSVTDRPKVRRFKPGRGDVFLGAIKISSRPSLGEQVKPEAPCRKILRHVKITCKYEQKYFPRPYSSFLSHVPPACYQTTLLVELAGSSDTRIRSFPPSTSFHHGYPCSYITMGVNSSPVGGRSS